MRLLHPDLSVSAVGQVVFARKEVERVGHPDVVYTRWALQVGLVEHALDQVPCHAGHQSSQKKYCAAWANEKAMLQLWD